MDRMEKTRIYCDGLLATYASHAPLCVDACTNFIPKRHDEKDCVQFNASFIFLRRPRHPDCYHFEYMRACILFQLNHSCCFTLSIHRANMYAQRRICTISIHVRLCSTPLGPRIAVMYILTCCLMFFPAYMNTTCTTVCSRCTHTHTHTHLLSILVAEHPADIAHMYCNLSSIRTFPFPRSSFRGHVS